MWYEDVIAVHTAVTDEVSHVQRLKSKRYFVWEEDEVMDLVADNEHQEKARVIVTDLFTKFEFDSWVDEFSESLQRAGYSWRYEFIEFEEDTRIYHHQWEWIHNG